MTPLLLASARAAVTDDVHECKYVRGEEGIRACTALFTEVNWGTDETAWVYFNRGTDYVLLGKFDKAMDDLNEAIKEAPGFADAYTNRAQVYWRMGQLQLAKADLDKVISLHTTYLQTDNGDARTVRYLATPSDSARISRAQIEIELGDIDDAVADADTAKLRAPNNPGAEATACWVHAVKGDRLDTALTDCNDAVDATPESAVFLYRRGFVRYRMNDIPGAIKDLDQSLMIQPKNAMALYMRGLAKAKSGDAAGSRSDMDAAAALSPKIGAFFLHFGIGT
jgi:tetratricopeptide (TPR) repeat protein